MAKYESYRPDSNKPEHWVRSSIVQPLVRLSLIFGAAAVVAGIGILWFLQSESNSKWGTALSTTQLALPLGLLIGLVSFLILVPIFRSPQAVGLGDFGITILYPFRRVTIAWDDLAAVRYVAQGLVVFELRKTKPSSPPVMHQVTIEQGRATLGDSRCPQIMLSDAFRRLIFG